MFQHVILSTSIKCCVHPKVDKRIKDAIVEFIVNRLVNDLDNEEEEPYPQKTFPGPMHKELTKPVKKILVTS